ncbi:MAG: hypothetical protein NXY57DRAFT_962664 [Lentinula lateritia]|uniref:Uncharacterized protein n=1 Tax=Lentinula lateritia TaxID=40482 RepID=A0ABQ8VXX4_9AGAR|nr:MAG: hypothetical protein NXY57DRAFT_962664 [Lentinula lateritia]KAJ4501228.1 hypothetical protein C8R41DRAFT_913220 [Lentinula lateritia]
MTTSSFAESDVSLHNMTTSFFAETDVSLADSTGMTSSEAMIQPGPFIVARPKGSARMAKLVVIACLPSLPKPTTPYQSELEDQKLKGIQSGTCATAESAPLTLIDMSVFDSAGIIAQLDKQSKGSILPILTKASLDLKSLDGFEELLTSLLISREPEWGFKVIFIGVGSALLGGIVMFLALAFL